MARNPSTDRQGSPFPLATLVAVWNTAKPVQGHDPAYVRKDACGAWIHWDKYGNTTPNGYGWEVDHILAVANGGSDDLSNLQPLQWQNNRAKGDKLLWTCEVKAAA